jgi:hypothetical protein
MAKKGHEPPTTQEDLDKMLLEMQGRLPGIGELADKLYTTLSESEFALSDVVAALIARTKTPHYCLETISNRFWGEYVCKHALPGLERVHAALVERAHDQNNKFDFNDLDDRIWYEPLDDKRKVIVHTMQNANWLYVWDSTGGYRGFHVRQWWKQYVPAKKIKDKLNKEWCAAEEAEFRKKGIIYAIQKAERLRELWSDGMSDGMVAASRPSLEEYRKNNFKPQYGDVRDSGYILSYQERWNEIDGSFHHHRELEIMCTCLIPSMICALFEEE